LPILHEARRAREDEIGRRGGDDDEVEIGGGEPGRIERVARRLGGQLARGHALGGDVPLADAGTGDDPLVGGVDAARTELRDQFVIGDDARRQAAAGTDDARVAVLHEVVGWFTGGPTRASDPTRGGAEASACTTFGSRSSMPCNSPLRTAS